MVVTSVHLGNSMLYSMYKTYGDMRISRLKLNILVDLVCKGYFKLYGKDLISEVPVYTKGLPNYLGIGYKFSECVNKFGRFTGSDKVYLASGITDLVSEIVHIWGNYSDNDLVSKYIALQRSAINFNS